MTLPEPAAAKRCRNCEALVSGNFCAECGQQVHLAPLTLASFLVEHAKRFFNVDGKTLATLRALLTRPGFLTREYWDGRRARYTEPRRLYLFASLVFFAAYSLFAGRNFVSVKIDRPNVTVDENAPWLVRRGAAIADMPREQLTASVKDAVRTQMPKIFFVLLPFFAFLTWVVFRPARRTYLQHMTFAFHLHAFAFLAMLPGFIAKNVELACFAAIGLYALWAMRRAYGLSFFASLWRYLIINAVYSLVMMLSLLALIFWKV